MNDIVHVLDVCPDCKGEGLVDEKVCEACEGTGMTLYAEECPPPER